MSLFHLRADQCRWPIGDPQQESFRWCSVGSGRQFRVKPVGRGGNTPARRGVDSVVGSERYATSPPAETRACNAPSGSVANG
jgi:hypothetical protein